MRLKGIVFLCVATASISSFMVACDSSSEGSADSAKSKIVVSDSVSSDYKPSRKAEAGFEWEEVKGVGLRFFAQRNESIRAVTDASVLGVRIERTVGGKKDYSEPVVKVFNIDANFIQSLLPQLRKSPRLPGASWLDSEECEFKEVESGRVGVTRYVLQLTGRSAELLAERGKREPVPYTCGGWGVGNSGMRYFEVFSSHPDKAVFVEIGQDAPLIDEKSIEPYDIVKKVKGEMVLGHEVRSFTADGDSASYWLIDGTDQARLRYRDVLGAGAASYSPVNVELEVQSLGRSLDGFSQDYDGVYFINKIISMTRK